MQSTRLKLTAVAALAAVALAACGSSSSNGRSASAAPSTAAPSSTGGSGAGGSQSATTSTIPSDTTPLSVPVIHGTISGPGVTASTITIGQITTTSGPVPGLFQGANDGLDAFANYVNSNGGLDGHRIKVIHEDDAFSCNTYTQELKSLSTRVFAVVGSYTLEDTCGKSVLTSDTSLLDIQGVILDPSLYSLPNVFTPTPLPPGFITTGYQWFKDRFPTAITKTASLYAGTSVADAKEQQLTAESIGYKYVYSRALGPTDTNFTSDILRMKNDGVKLVDLTSDNVQTDATFVQEAAQQGFKPDAIFSSSAYDSHFLQLLGSTAANNVYAPLTYSLFLGQDRAAVPGLNTFLDELDKVKPGESANLFSVAAWGAGLLMADAMSKAGSSVTPATTIKAMSQITSFDAGGLISPSNPAQQKPSVCMVIAGIHNGKWVRVQPSSGFECNGAFYPVSTSKL